jgi:hypothetical protein
LENELKLTSHIEGKYIQQTKKLVTKLPNQLGVVDAYYEKSAAREAYTLPFTKTAIDKLQEDKTPFGPDSVNIADSARVDFDAKIQNVLVVQSFRCGGFT